MTLLLVCEKEIIIKNNTVENLQFLKKLKIELPPDSATALLGVYPKEVKTGVHTKSLTQTFIVALSAIVKEWE